MWKSVWQWCLVIFVLAGGPAAQAQLQANLAVTKSGPAVALPGADVPYTVTVTNGGPDSATNVTLTDQIPDDMTFVSATQDSGPPFNCSDPGQGGTGAVTCTIAALLPSASAQFTFTFRIDPDVVPGTQFTNRAVVSSSTADPASANNTATATTTTTAADLTVAKSGPESATPGSNVTYVVTMTNLGPQAATDATITDTIPPGMTFVSVTQNSGPAGSCAAPNMSNQVLCTIPSLPASSSAQFSFVFNIPAATPGGTFFTNVATVSTREAGNINLDPNEENNSAFATTSTPPPPQGDLVVMKSGPSGAAPDTDVTFTITLLNGGPDAATTVELTDTLPAPLTFVGISQTGQPLGCTTPAGGANGTITCTAGSYPAGASTTISLTVHIPPNTVTGTEFTNTANVTSANDPNTENNSGTTTVTISAVDVSVAKAGPPNAVAGSTVSYGITVTNSGPDPAQTVVLSDQLPAGTTFVSLVQNSGPAAACEQPPGGSGGTVVCSIPQLNANQSALFTLVIRTQPNATQVSNTAAVTTESFDTDPSDNQSTATTPLVFEANLGVTKTGPATVTAGNNVSYTVSVTNAGPSNAPNVRLADTPSAGLTFVSASQTSGAPFNCSGLPANPCTISSLPVGATATFSFVFAVSPSATGTVTNTATVTSDVTDPATSNNTSAVTSNVTTSANVAVTKAGPSTVTAGTTVTYNVTVTNNGPSDAASVTLADVLPADATFVSATQNSGPAFNCTQPNSGATGTISCSIATLARSATATFTFVFAVAPDATGQLNNTATVSTTTSDPVPSNNAATAMAIIATSADVGVTKTGPAAVTAGTNVTYTVTVTNIGPSTATNVAMGDTLPGDTTLVSRVQNSGPAFNCTGPGPGETGTIYCTIPALAPSSTATFTFVLAVSPNATGTLGNTAAVTAATADPVSSNNSSTVFTNVGGSADLAVAKSGPATVTAGTNATYTVTVSNAGPSTATNVTLADTFPAGTTLTFTSQTSGPVFNCTNTTSSISCTTASMAPGAQAAFTFTVSVSPAATASITNTATVSSSTADPAGTNNSASATSTVNTSADLGVFKGTLRGERDVTAGTDLTYTALVVNSGPSTARNVTLTEVIPPGTTFVSVTQGYGPPFTCTADAVAVTCTIAALDPGLLPTFNFVFRVSPAATGEIVNTMTIASTSTVDPNASNNSSSITMRVNSSADVSVAKAGPSFASAGTNATYNVTVANSGPSTAATVTLTETIPAGTTLVSATQTGGPAFACTTTATAVTCSIAALDPAAPATFTFVFAVAPETTGTITNTASVTTLTPEFSLANNAAVVTTPVRNSADLAVTKTGPAVVTAGSNVTYTVALANGGPSTATNVTLTDFIPGGTSLVSVTQTSGPSFNCTSSSDRVTCTIASLAPSAQASFDLVFNVAPTTSGSIENTAAVTTGTPDPNAGNNTSTITSGINPGPTDLAITKTASVERAGFGAPVTYTITVTNNGPSTAFGTTVTDVLPAGSTFVSATPSQGTCSGTTTVVCNLGTLAPSAAASIALQVRLPAAAGTVNNTATVSAVNAETGAGNNASTAAIAVTTEIPALSASALALLALALAAAAVVVMRAQ